MPKDKNIVSMDMFSTLPSKRAIRRAWKSWDGVDVVKEKKPLVNMKLYKTTEISDSVWKLHGIPPPEREYHFRASPDQRQPYRIDFAWPKLYTTVREFSEHLCGSVVHRGVAVEIDGGLWIGGAHSRGKGITRDHHKRNAMVVAGWKLLIYSPKGIDFEQIKELLGKT